MPTDMSSASDVARAFALGTPTGELTHVARGAMGVVYRLDTDHGPFAVKRLLWGPTGGEEANAALQLAAADAGVPLPRPLRTTNGDILKRFDDGWWRAYEWVDEVPGEAADPVEVATALGRLHALAHDADTTRDEWYCAPIGPERLNNAIDIAIKHGLAFAPRRECLFAFDAIVAAAPEETLLGCHLDTDRKNVMVSERGAVLIDWDNAGPGIAASEFGSTIADWADDDPAVVAAMVRAYRAEGVAFAPTGLSVFAMGLCAFVHYVVMCAEHLDWDGTGDEQLAFERPFLEHVASTPMTVERYERLLEMVPGE